MWWNSYVGIKFAPQGRTREGCDCAGLACLVYREQLKRNIDQDMGYYNPLDCLQTSGLLQECLKPWMPIETPEDFDLVQLRIFGEPCHIGIICDGGKGVLNVRAGVNAIIERLEDWLPHIEGYWRLPC